MSEADRIEDIDYWWQGGFPGAFAAESRGDAVEPRLYVAVRQVLLAMPDEDFERFFILHPQIVCQPPVVEGTLWRYFVPVMPEMKEAIVRVIYFTPAIRKWSAERLVRLVAHEIAHLILGHADSQKGVGHGDIHAEEATDRKAESWGFHGAYSKAERRRLATRHAGDKARESTRRK